MERASIEPAIKLIIAEIHSNSAKQHALPRPPRPVSRTALSLRASRSQWISSNSFMKPGGSMTPPRCSTV